MRALLLIAVALLLAGGGVWASAEPERATRPAAERPSPPVRTRTPEPRRRIASPLPASSCPAGVPACRSVSGRVLFVESVDPDGDGDLHVILAGGGVSGPGITAVDVKPSLRPRVDPRVGDRVSAAGPVQPGSYGQAQVHALDLHLRRR